MALKGAISKELVTKKILETFEGSFLNDKEIRIRCIEDGAEVQIKVTLTAAKTNVEAGSDIALPGTNAAPIQAPPPSSYVPPNDEEKAAVAALIKRMQNGTSA